MTRPPLARQSFTKTTDPSAIYAKHKADHNHGYGAESGHGSKRLPEGKSHGVFDTVRWFSRHCLNYVPVNWPIKVMMTAAATWLLSRAVTGAAEVKMAKQDIVVYCTIYCGWAIFFLPDILLHVSAYILGKVFWLLLRLFLAEVLLGLYLHFFKHESNVWQRGLGLRPIMGPEYQWMEETVHSIRFILIVGCLSASIVANLFDRPEILIDYVETEDEEEPNRDF